MRKLCLFALILLGAVSISAKTIYLNTGGSNLWGAANPEFFVHAWAGEEEYADVHMTLLTGDIYYAEIPDGSTQCIFLRQKTGSTSIAWSGDNFWNKTGELTIGANNCFTITEWSNGTWSVYCTPDYGIMVGEIYTPATINPENTAEYMLTGLSLKKDDTFTLYNNCAKMAWVITTIKEGSTTNITIVDNKYVVGATGTYDIYFELSFGADKIYIGYTASTPTAVTEVNGIAADEPMYNLLGVRVDNTYRGIVIQGGKKYFLK